MRAQFRVWERENSFQDISLAAVLVPSNTDTKPTLLANEMACKNPIHPSSEYARVVGHRHIKMDFAIEIVRSPVPCASPLWMLCV
jgi:hypothetical protein